MVDKATPDKAEPKVGRNDSCPCDSGKKYKQCHGAAVEPPSEEIPPCSVEDCSNPPHWFLSPSVDGHRVADRYWVACRAHAKHISASAAEEGMDIHVIPIASLQGKTVGPLDPVAGPGAKDSAENLAERMQASQDEILANTILDFGEHKGKKYRDVYGDPPYKRDGPGDAESFEPPRLWTPPGV